MTSPDETTDPVGPEPADEPEVPEQHGMPRAVCGLALFVKPNGAGLHIHQMKPEQEPVERVATPADIRGMISELEQQLQAEMTVKMMEHRAMQQQQAAINDQIATAALKDNGKRGMSLPGWMSGRRR